MLTATDTVHDISTQLSNMINYRARDNGGQVRQCGVLQVGDDLLDDGVVTVSGLCSQHRLRTVGEHRVIPIDGEQLALARRARRRPG
jgi:hypothetical protein